MPPFLADEHIDIPNKDLLSWMFDEQKYDVDKPVRMYQLPS
jgi:4-coumarate--CoA ligase